MSHLICRQRGILWAALSLSVTILFGGIPIGLAGEPAPPPDPDGDPSAVQERAVTRQLIQPELKQVAPAPAKQIDKSAVIGDQRTPSTVLPSQPTGPSPIVVPPTGAIFEPDYKYPWVVSVQSRLGCRGVLLDPRWVLTAAHCVQLSGATVTYVRKDPTTGATQTQTRTATPGSGGVYYHEQYSFTDPDQANDIALIKVVQPFTINPYLQTVGLPRDFRRPGVVGTVANFSHNVMTPAGQVAIFRAPIQQDTYPPKFNISATTANAALCPGDSGSGFVTVENGRATVRGIASQGTQSDCMMVFGEATFTDVYAFRGWILGKMAMSDASLTGNTRIRWSGYSARGTMVVACFNPNGNLVGPLNVVGVEEGAVCEAGQTQTVMCNLDKNQTGSKLGPPMLTGLTIRTTTNGASQVQTISPSGNSASFFGLLPAGTSREFTCQIGSSLTSAVGGAIGSNMAVMSRGVEREQPAEPIVEQPSPFDLPGESK